MFAPRRTPGSGLHLCSLCHAESVVPVWWESVDDARWRLILRCGECESFREIVVGDDLVHAFERDLERGAGEIRATLDRLDRERMAVQVNALIIALRCDLIDAADFA